WPREALIQPRCGADVKFCRCGLLRLEVRRRSRAFAEEELFHLAFQELAGLRLDRAEAVFVDQHGLVAQPFPPGFLGHVFVDALAEFARMGRARQAGRFAAEADAVNHSRHVGLPCCERAWGLAGWPAGGSPARR